MYDRIRKHRGALTIAAAIFFGGAGWALASIPGTDGAISACYATRGGELRIIDSTASCRARETAIRWNQQGVQGPVGPPGPGVAVLDGFEPATVSVTHADTPTPEDFVDDGPTLTVDVPAGGALVQFMASVEVDTTDECRPEVTVSEVPDEASHRSLIHMVIEPLTVPADFTPIYSNAENGSEAGGYWTVRHLNGGAHTFRMRYRVDDHFEEPVCASVGFRNRHLYGTVLG